MLRFFLRWLVCSQLNTQSMVVTISDRSSEDSLLGMAQTFFDDQCVLSNAGTIRYRTKMCWQGVFRLMEA